MMVVRRVGATRASPYLTARAFSPVIRASITARTASVIRTGKGDAMRRPHLTARAVSPLVQRVRPLLAQLRVDTPDVHTHGDR